jgi:hypothetical protein
MDDSMASRAQLKGHIEAWWRARVGIASTVEGHVDDLAEHLLAQGWQPPERKPV